MEEKGKAMKDKETNLVRMNLWVNTYTRTLSATDKDADAKRAADAALAAFDAQFKP
jgi:hypothetical protein